jgi:5-methylcytosine-specific restriction protein A
MNQAELVQWLNDLIASNNLHEFYTSSVWLKLRAEVLEEFKHECQDCKARGYYKKADTVHHVQYVKKHPELALSKFYEFAGKIYRNLIALCHECHERRHEYRQKEKKKPLTEERW